MSVQELFNTSLLKNMRFENFMTGESNFLACQTAITVAELNHSDKTPLFICGDVGLGKTHLMAAIANRLMDSGMELSKIAFWDAESFCNAPSSMQKETQIPFQEKLHGISLLLFDVVSFISKRWQAQETLCQIFDTMKASRKQIVFSSIHKPEKIPNVSKGLQSRFRQAMVLEILPPDLNLRLAIIRQAAAAEGLSVPDEVAFLFANNPYGTSIRALKTMITTLGAFARLVGRKIDLQMAQDLLDKWLD